MQSAVIWLLDDPIRGLIIGSAAMLVFGLFFAKFAELTEPQTWDPPPRFLTSKVRYVVWRLVYAGAGTGAYVLVYILLDPLASATDAIDGDLVNTRLAPVVAAFIVTGLAFDFPLVNHIEKLLRKGTHRLALIPARSHEIAADITTSPMVGEPSRNNDDKIIVSQYEQFRNDVEEYFGDLGVDRGDLDAARNSYVYHRLRVLHLYRILEDDWEHTKPYANFFKAARPQWEAVKEGYRDIRNGMRSYEKATKEERQQIEHAVENYLTRLTQFISYIILSMERIDEDTRATALSKLNLRPTVAPSMRIRYTPVAIFAILGFFTLPLVMLVLFLVRSSITGTAFKPLMATRVGVFYYCMTVFTIWIVFWWRNRGLHNGSWPLPRLNATESWFNRNVILRPWERYAECVLIGMVLGSSLLFVFQTVAFPPYFEIKAVKRFMEFTPIALCFSGLTALFVAHYIDGARITSRSYATGLVQGLVTAVLMLGAAYLSFGALGAIPAPRVTGAVLSTTVFGFLIGLLVGWPGTEMIKDDLNRS